MTADTNSGDERDAHYFSDIRPSLNVGETERVISALSGVALAALGLSRRTWPGIGLAMFGGYCIYRGLSGKCLVYDALDHSTAELDELGILVDKSITINRPADELYKYWSDFENLPSFMQHLEAVWMTGDHRYHWVAKAPAGMRVEWDADVVIERPAELIAWQSLAGSEIPNEGSVRFTPAVGGRGTVVRVMLRYYPPGGTLGSWFAKLFGEEPNQQVEEDLMRFKQFMETGELPTVEGQPSGRMPWQNEDDEED